jgi:hypothetical protein
MQRDLLFSQNTPAHPRQDFLMGLPTEELVIECKKNETDALLVLSQPPLREKLGKYDVNALGWLHERSPSGTADANRPWVKAVSGDNLFAVCNAHASTRQYVLDHLTTFQPLLNSTQLQTITTPQETQIYHRYL